MSDDASTPAVPENTAANAGHNPWSAPGSVPEGAEGPQYARPEGQTEPRDTSPEGHTEPHDAEPVVTLDKGAAAADQAGAPHPAPLSVHDQQTVTSLPGVTPAAGAGAPQGWASPAAPPAHGSLASFPPPSPATAAGGAHPFAPPVVQDGAVPPPPIAPDGPGQMPYGYPGGHGYAAPAGYPAPAGHGGAPGYYGWPGTRPMENGMGITAMVLGIIAAGGFCMWPAAIVTGVLAVIFGLIGRAKAARGEASNPGQALAGIICGAAGFVLGIALVVLVVVAD
ncbi:hypothetical protein ACIBBD_18760 [Streptomyces sp. NPDC051315]|uniref:hypothetical protein n=1 Tax=Streptomyces sp. NPDC051315 TaxID=3365650 RepID=UPI0037AC9BC4